jgi:hypothetical protein
MTQIIVEDDFLPETVYWSLANLYEKNTTRDVKRHIFEYDPTPQIAKYIDRFIETRPYIKLGKFIHTASTPPNFNHPVHDEADFKIMSAIVYIAPKESHGTTFYLDKKYEVEWKPNRMMVFCGKSGVTWHDYKSLSETRLTYNYFLVDPTKIENETYKNNILRMR